MPTDLQAAPGVGPAIADCLRELGVRDLEALAKQDPERLYARLCRQRGAHVDSCVLYVFRCAIYFASRSRHDPELLKWWNWKNRALKLKS